MKFCINVQAFCRVYFFKITFQIRNRIGHNCWSAKWRIDKKDFHSTEKYADDYKSFHNLFFYRKKASIYIKQKTTYKQMILHNFIIQTSTLFLGITAGFIISWLAQEEIEIHRDFIGNTARIVFAIAILLSFLFTTKHIIIGLIALTYCILGIWQQKEVQAFFWIAPLPAFLSSASPEGFLTILACIFIATVLSITILLSAYTENKKIQWNKEIFFQILRIYLPFIIITCLSYLMQLQHYFNI